MNMGLKFDISEIEKYILEEIRKNKDFLFNELDLQMLVARALEKEFKEGYRVHLEYHLPKGWNNTFDKEYSRWGTEKPYFDIVLESMSDDGTPSRFIAIELKYKLKEVSSDNNFSRFGTKPEKANVILVTNHSAENEGRYDFWKDVKRLELLKTCFSENVIGGIAIFVTNQPSYMITDGGNKYSQFDFREDNAIGTGGFMYWDYTGKQICQNSGVCGDDFCKSTPCGERLREPSSNNHNRGLSWADYVRPNFSLKNTYFGKWFPSKEGFSGPMSNLFYCYYVTV